MQINIKGLIYTAALYLGKIRYHNRRSKVLYYHDVHGTGEIPETPMSTPMSLFEKHIAIIRDSGFEIVAEINKPYNQVMLTFDDGYLGLYKNQSFFIDQGLKPTVFIITDSIGEPHFMDTTQLLKLQQKGFRFQSHTHTHPDLNLQSAATLASEYNISSEILKELLHQPIDEICFPKGFFNQQTISVAYKHGYKKLYSSIPGAFYNENEFEVICRNLVQFSSPFDFKCILFGGLNIFKGRYSKQHYHA